MFNRIKDHFVTHIFLSLCLVHLYFVSDFVIDMLFNYSHIKLSFIDSIATPQEPCAVNFIGSENQETVFLCVYVHETN